MAAPFDDHVLSPELALVDADLAVRARRLDRAETTPSPTSRVPPPTRSAVVSRLPPTSTSRPTRSTLIAGSVIVLGALLVSGARPSSHLPSDPSAAAAAVAGRSAAVRPMPQTNRLDQPAPVAREPVPQEDPQRRATTSADIAAPASLSSAAEAETLPPRATLSWTRVARATSYELVLVRSGRVIFRASQGAPVVHVPGAWTSGGTTYRLQPEDEAYVWAIVDGQREARPLVDGVLALDLMLGAAVAPTSRVSG